MKTKFTKLCAISQQQNFICLWDKLFVLNFKVSYAEETEKTISVS